MDIITDYNNFLTLNEIYNKYKHLGLTKSKLETFIRQNKLNRNRPSFTNRFNNIPINYQTNQIKQIDEKNDIIKPFKPIDEVDKQIPTEFYSNIKTQQEESKDILPNAPKPKRNIKTKVVKIKEDIEKPVKRSNKKQEPKKIENKEPIKDEINDELKNLKNKILSRTDENIAKYKK